jgi:polyisoprenoid-binding protein YceI
MFAISSIDKTSEKDIYNVTGDLTIKGITNPISFKSNITKDLATAKIIVDRSKYDVRYGSNSFFDNLGDKAIYDDFELNVELVLE